MYHVSYVRIAWPRADLNWNHIEQSLKNVMPISKLCLPLLEFGQVSIGWKWSGIRVFCKASDPYATKKLKKLACLLSLGTVNGLLRD